MFEKIKKAIEKMGVALIRGIRWVIAATKRSTPAPAPQPASPTPDPMPAADRPAAQTPPVPPETSL
jgi:hypothetical protein